MGGRGGRVVAGLRELIALNGRGPGRAIIRPAIGHFPQASEQHVIEQHVVGDSN